MRGLSLRTRLTGWYTLGLGSTLLVFGVLVDRALVGTLRREFDERLASAAGVVQFAVVDMIRDQGVDAAAGALLRQLHLIDVSVAIATVQPDGSRIPFSGSDPLLLPALSAGPCRDAPITRRPVSGAPYRLLARCLQPESGAPLVAVLVGAPEEELRAETRRIQTIVVFALLAGLGLTTLGGHWLSGKAIAPIRRMGARVREIGSENLDQRLPVARAEGEIAELSGMVNALFDRLAATLGRERQFFANAAHALRTPVALLQGEVAEAGRERDLAEIETLVGHLGRTVEYLLALARRDAGTEPIACEALFLDDVVSGTVARLGRMADQRSIRLVWGELAETSVVANAHVADQVTQILLENALQYTPAQGAVRISVTPHDGAGRLVVEDTGPGLAPEDLAALFTPFVRGSAARRSGAPGSGLGLAVAQWMVQSCGGSISAEPVQPHGARFVVRLPTSPINRGFILAG